MLYVREYDIYICFTSRVEQEMACQCERGLPACPVTVSTPRSANPPSKPSSTTCSSSTTSSKKQEEAKRKRDYETLADMEKRRKNERALLIAEMLRHDGVDDD